MRTVDLKRLNFRHLYYFWVVAKDSHLTRAAERLHVSQSAVSSQIRRLETALGYELFERRGRTLSLTEAGQVVLGYAESIFSLGRELLATTGGAMAGEPDYLRVGAVANLSRNFQQNLLKPLYDRPGIRLILESASLDELLERLKVHKLDLILGNRPIANSLDSQLSCHRVAQQAVSLVGPPRDFAGGFDMQRELGGFELLLPGHSSDIRTQFEQLCSELGITPTIRADVDDMAMLRLLARDSGAVAVVPDVVVQDELSAGHLQKYCELPGIKEYFYAVTTRRQFENPLVEELLKTVS